MFSVIDLWFIIDFQSYNPIYCDVMMIIIIVIIVIMVTLFEKFIFGKKSKREILQKSTKDNKKDENESQLQKLYEDKYTMK